MRTTEKQRLLHDVVRDEDYRAFREGLRVDLLGQVRRQRAARRRHRLLAMAACLPIALGVVFLRPPRHVPSGPAAPAYAVEVVRTVPLEPGSFVATRTAESIRTSPAGPGISVLVTVVGRAGTVRTSLQALPQLTDEQLLDLFKGQAVALVTEGPGRRQLLFPGDDDTRR